MNTMMRLVAALALAAPATGWAKAAPLPALPLPPTPAGNAPADVLTAPIAPSSGVAQTVHPLSLIHI